MRRLRPEAAPGLPFRWFEIAPPNHLGYVQFPAALLLIFALMFARIAQDPVAHRGLIAYGILLKVAYVAVAGGHWLGGGVPAMWKPFVIVDLVMGVLFIWAWSLLGRAGAARAA